MPDFETKIKTLFSDQEKSDKRYLKLLEGNDDVVSIVLRGHLIMEELLVRTVEVHCQCPQHLEGIQFRFPQLVSLVRALEKIPAAPEKLWRSLALLNALRNSLAHKLDPSDLSSRISTFVRNAIGESVLSDLKVPPDSNQAVRLAICSMLGQLSVVSVFHSSLEHLIVERLSNRGDPGKTHEAPSS